VTVNATGAWAGKVADMADIEGVRVLPGRGIMIAMNHRLVDTVVNRCQMPTDGDILVPIRTVSVMGTTDVHTDDPDDHTVAEEEVDAMLEDGERLVPGFRQARALRVWTGVRPLFQDAKDDVASTRDVTRAHTLLDHAERDGVGGFVTITGGKLTTFRLMAEETVDAVCRQLGENRPCTTTTERNLRDEQLVCECELITRTKLEESMRMRGTDNLGDFRRVLRLGMGPCQGGFCIYRATGIMHGIDGLTAEQANQALLSFLQERWKGVWPILYGDQLRQARLDDWIFQGVLDVGHLG
jgi:glycerol-3-phosphate dehydrogenase